MLWGEPVEAVRARIADIASAAAEADRPTPRISLSLRLYIGATERAAWELARSEPVYQEFMAKGGLTTSRNHAQDVGRNRQLEFSRAGEVHDERLWMGIVAALRGLGNAAALVGTEDQVLAELQRYADVGVDRFLIAGAGGNWQPELSGTARRIKNEIRPRSAAGR